MRLALILGCIALVLIGVPSTAQARRGGRGRGGGKYAAAMWKMGMAQMQMMAAQEQYAAAQRAEAHRQQVAAHSALREKQLAEMESRREARLAGQGK
ncbi:MAG TPA: hypothetical protein VHC22_34160 [Pirellulales bacterium]|nr:hypothetical protein [Pirellulales bacterium]